MKILPPLQGGKVCGLGPGVSQTRPPAILWQPLRGWATRWKVCLVQRFNGRSLLIVLFLLVSGTFQTRAADLPWWKGNLHTHTLWSDGDDYPEMVVRWYKAQGYQFLALSDHNVMLEGKRWTDPATNKGGMFAISKYRATFGTEWVETRLNQGRQEVRLRTLKEFRRLFEEPGRFLLIPSEEITDKYKKLPIHLNATNLRRLIKPRGGDTVLEVMQNNVNAVLRQRAETGQPMIPHLNHPNFGWAVTPEDLMRVEGERFFEVYNGHPDVHNAGDATRPSTDQMWDRVLAWRLTELDLPVLYGLAVDDTHHYHTASRALSNAGRGWIVVQAAQLNPESIIRALEEGSFYASTGVALKKIVMSRAEQRLTIEIQAEPGVQFTTQFIGTRRGSPNELKEGSAPISVSATNGPPGIRAIGETLQEVKGNHASYRLQGDELYVRARVISSREKANAAIQGEREMAWVQPWVQPR